MKYVDLRTGQRVDAPEEYDSNLVAPGGRLDIDNLEALRTAGESEDVINTLSSVGSPASYQASPDAEIISADDPRFPWDLLERHIPGVREASARGENIRTASKPTITSPPNVFTDSWWPFCSNNSPSGVKWNPPTTNGYNGQYYVKGTWGNVYLWGCGSWSTPNPRTPGIKVWRCPSYEWWDWAPAWTQSQGPYKSWPRYTCR